jgi:hypothetical protein
VLPTPFGLAVIGANVLSVPGKSDIGGVNLPGLLALMITLVVVFLPVLLSRGGSPPGQAGPDSEDGWGNGPRQPPQPPVAPQGGVPLNDAEPPQVRLRDHGRLADHLPTRDRRATREPERSPERTSRRS